jgi:hypothetical protein
MEKATRISQFSAGLLPVALGVKELAATFERPLRSFSGASRSVRAEKLRDAGAIMLAKTNMHESPKCVAGGAKRNPGEAMPKIPDYAFAPSGLRLC